MRAVRLPLMIATGVLLAGGTLASALGMEPASSTSCVMSPEHAGQASAAGAPAPGMPGQEDQAFFGGAAPARPPAAPAAPARAHRVRVGTVNGDAGHLESIFDISTSPVAGIYEVLGARQPRVDLDLQNVPAPEALKRTLDQAAVKYVLDPDIPEDVRVTVKVKNIQLHTALSLITEAAGVGWNTEHKLAAALAVPKDLPQEERDRRVAEAAAITYRVGKTISTRSNLPRVYFQGREGVVAPSLQLSQGLVPYAVFGREEHSTFTCPHCKQQSTMVRVKQQPKCPKCARIYQSDWQYCPADGTRRPANPGEWRFCPACGKQVQPEKANDPADPAEKGLPAPDRLGEHEGPLAPVAHMPGGWSGRG